MARIQYILPALFALGAVALSSVFIVDEREQVLVMQFGQVKQEIKEPGLGFKLPLVQDVVRYEDRILGLQSQSLEVTLRDNRRLVMDAFARWRITNAVDFREAVGPGGVDEEQTRLDPIISAAMRQVLHGGNHGGQQGRQRQCGKDQCSTPEIVHHGSGLSVARG